MRSTMGDEMILNLAARLGASDLSKTAAKKDDDDKDEKDEDKKDEDKKDEKDKEDKDDKDEKDNGNDKKAAVMDVLNGLSKLASELDEIGADDASAAVDEALRVIVHNIQKEKKSNS